jgi:hypothetical protein
MIDDKKYCVCKIIVVIDDKMIIMIDDMIYCMMDEWKWALADILGVSK